MSGILFTNRLSIDRFTTNQILLNGSGVAAGDIDGDGWCDLFFAGLTGSSVLYRNNGAGDGFQNITDASGIAVRDLDVTGAAFADLDGDDDLDLIFNTVGSGTHFWMNDGHGGFQRGQELNSRRGGTSLALADWDGDGSLDLYISNYRPETLRDRPRTNFKISQVDGKFVVAAVNGQSTDLPALQGRFTYDPASGITEHGEPDAPYRNDGRGRFVPLSFTNGVFVDEDGMSLTTPPYDWGLSVLVRDLTGDGLPDIYVCNDFASPDRFWINRGDGRFRAAPKLSLRNTSHFSMGIDAADVNRDGHDDLVILDMLSRDPAMRLTRMDASMGTTRVGEIQNRPQLSRNTLQLNRGDGTYAEIAQFAGLDASEWSWAPVFIDVDLDGYEDLLVTTGHARDDMHIDYGSRIEALRRTKRLSVPEELALRRSTPALQTPSLAFRNKGNLQFEEVGKAWGFSDRPGIAHGMCLADLDNDGDLDVVVNCLNGPAAFYRNEAVKPRIAVRLKGRKPNTRGIGARIRLLGKAVSQSQEMVCGGRYLSSDDTLRVFAADDSLGPLRLEVRWRSGRTSIVEKLEPNRIYEIDEESSAATGGSRPRERLPQVTQSAGQPLFEDASELLSNHQHVETPFDDFERQPLLPRRWSQPGPGVGWIDLNRDGREDLVIGSGRGGPPGIFLSTNGPAFVRLEADAVERDQTGVVGLVGPDQQPAVLFGSTAYEDPVPGFAGLHRFSLARGWTNLLLETGASIGPLAVADFDGDGDLDLFAGGGPRGGRYPEATPSHLYENHDGHWVTNAALDAVIRNLHLVRGATWSDLDGDSLPELIVTSEWDSPRIYQYRQGKLEDVSARLGLTKYRGWWTGIAAGDFDEDGRMDLVAGNWGLNSKYRPGFERPTRLYHGDFAQLGKIELFEAAFDPARGRWMPERNLFDTSRQWPALRARYPLHRNYAEAGMEQMLGDRFRDAPSLEATWLASTLFLNRTNHFEVVPLPMEAQWSPVFGVNVADFDGDGHMDLFLSQNFFAESPANSRNDAGRALILLGNGRGGLVPMTATESGIAVYGEQRGSAVCDYDEDGRVDLVVTQNGAATRLFHNRKAPPGVRIRLQGLGNNPLAVGARLRARVSGEKWGPALQVDSGSGYWSCNSSVLVIPKPSGPVEVEVQWSAGPTSRHRIDASMSSVTLKQPNP